MSDDASDLYQRLIMERARHPLHAGRVEAAQAEAEGNNPMCGDRVRLSLRCDEAGVIIEAAHETRGCAICVASADVLAETVIGRAGSEMAPLAVEFETMVQTGLVPAREDFAMLQAFAGVSAYRSRHRCATLPWQALTAAMNKRRELEHG
ncbi:MAG TPA: SUF system NifU family Fe-S cluster assembly protein [Acidiphilium sp.]|nr:MAG: SUF system NifU family Fe-S cluster assembly protein [Acidiphilium sp. 21-60-14]OYV90446.1 MAG: SUF system NifU family Fe-S cluster assembly protein [Acidiphilium sp. 37-60-79]OZB38840.1 MAG: SUF system NifU family Fe-S cluster assembly protein [Acidiphilium sp. 34-60-192]HQT87747.1 SUF system NifU family Fe-S cluster assembly protein [Acidiphilium sp.]HQU22874.1 SUF system NifU family Fe-S cluster assembly protein [Acidiphilium sp.]